jgi:alpha-beta hydrolase superfamily lysophospholipase
MKIQINKKRLRKWATILLLAYGLIGIAIYYLQDYFLFQATPLRKDHQYDFSMPFREVNLDYTTTQNLNIIQFETSAPVRGVVLYFHGNRRNISWYARFAPMFTEKGYEVWMIDYPGYGKSTGHITESALFDYASQLYKLAGRKFGADSIIIFGKSIGTGIAAQLASSVKCKRVILETPYYSLSTVAARFFPIYPMEQMTRVNIRTYEYLPYISAPITIFHGTSDQVISYENASRLKPMLKAGDEFITISGAGHSNLRKFPVFEHKIDSLLER